MRMYVLDSVNSRCLVEERFYYSSSLPLSLSLSSETWAFFATTFFFGASFFSGLVFFLASLTAGTGTATTTSFSATGISSSAQKPTVNTISRRVHSHTHSKAQRHTVGNGKFALVHVDLLLFGRKLLPLGPECRHDILQTALGFVRSPA